jgi:hypothetical protein
MTAYERGKLAYDVYCESVGGVAFNGDQLPPFDEDGDGPNRDQIRAAWIAAAAAVAADVTGADTAESPAPREGGGERG